MRSLAHTAFAVVSVTAVLAGCNQPRTAVSTPLPLSTDAVNALWALAPAGATSGFVATPAALQLVESGAVTIRDFLAHAPELAWVTAMLESVLRASPAGRVNSLAELGLDRSKGFAIFTAADGPVVVVPLADRNKLMRVMELADTGPDRLGRSTCKHISGAYVCAASAQTLATTGTSRVPAALQRLGARGDMEGFVDTGGFRAVAVAELERGMVVVRGAVDGVPMEEAFAVPNKARVEPSRTAAFAVFDPRSFIADLPDQAIAPGVSAAVFGRSVGAPVTVTVAPGTLVPDVRIPLAERGPAAAVFATCPDIVPAALRAPVQKPGMCRVVIAPLGITLDIWVDGQSLRIGANPAAAVVKQTALTPLGKELASGAWSVAVWGRGSPYGAAAYAGVTASLPAEASQVLRAMSVVNELGIGVRHDDAKLTFIAGIRTLWANPPDVVAKVLVIPASEVVSGGGTAQRVADAAPTSPFAADLAAGPGGLMLPVGTVGLLAAVAVPAFTDYMKRSRRTPAEVTLRKLGESAERYYAAHGTFPKGEGPLTPADTCCGKHGNRCTTTSADWAAGAWPALDFAIDEPTHHRYGYRSDGASFMAVAVADLDCDGETATFTLTGTVRDGVPNITLTPPPRGEY